jgi:hypothetical protein
LEILSSKSIVEREVSNIKKIEKSFKQFYTLFFAVFRANVTMDNTIKENCNQAFIDLLNLTKIKKEDVPNWITAKSRKNS